MKLLSKISLKTKLISLGIMVILGGGITGAVFAFNSNSDIEPNITEQTDSQDNNTENSEISPSESIEGDNPNTDTNSASNGATPSQNNANSVSSTANTNTTNSSKAQVWVKSGYWRDSGYFNDIKEYGSYCSTTGAFDNGSGEPMYCPDGTWSDGYKVVGKEPIQEWVDTSHWE